MKQDRVDKAMLPKEVGNMERFLALHEFEPEARQRLPRAVYEYVAGGAGEEYSIRANEGGRNLDTVIPPIEALPDITQQVAGRVPLLVDGGIRRGTDALKALLRGANAVLIGRPYLYALAVGGADGVARCLSLLIEELRLAMALVGAASLPDLDRDVEWPVPSAFGPRAFPTTASI